MSKIENQMGDDLPSEADAKLRTRQAFAKTFVQETDKAILQHLHRIIYNLEKRVEKLEVGN